MGAEDGFCSNVAARFCRSVQFCAWVTISYSLGILRLVAERAEGPARAGLARGCFGHLVTSLPRATLCQVMASLVVITRPLNADMIPPNDLIS